MMLVFLVAPLVFVVTVGEIDLSFPATFGFNAWTFALVTAAGYSPMLGIVAAIATGIVLGFDVGARVVYGNLSSLIATLGMNFVLPGVIQIITQGRTIALVELSSSPAHQVRSGTLYGISAQIGWGIAFVVFAALLYNTHRFGARVRCVGDNPDSTRQMGIDMRRVRMMTFAFMGFGAALAGILLTLINVTLWSTAGGTPTWGGIGTVAGGRSGQSARRSSHSSRPAWSPPA